MSTHIAVLPKEFQEALERSGSSLRPLQLPHPRTGLQALFVYHGSTMLELHSVTPDAPRSWFVGQSVVSNGNLMLMTPIDPVFILIPFLQTLDPKAPFKPTDDFLEEALLKYSVPDVNKQDVALFMTLGCARRALKQLCETKGSSPRISLSISHPRTHQGFHKTKSGESHIRSTTPSSRARVSSTARTASPASNSSTSTTAQSFPAIQRQHLRLGLSVEELGPLDCPKAEAIRAATRIKIASEIVGNWVEEGLMADVLGTYDISAYTDHAAVRAEQARAELAAATSRAEAAEAGKGGKSKAGEKRKAGAQASRGVDKLKKANTKGMATLNTFFGKKE
ncbi:Ydr279p protein family (RNase H2 complex component) [Rhizoctonia solani]|uniref:Ydr279p protein family (RNase H2 complex component) n=1 Tax=Rhizoctonia solani TaxID=456999 RepID=A0A8H8P096_9AGAM|nr:Ydr279p protein family (RNase H2 complex component) [Rhizoctonia solani]QRW21591.1 Ydr279p protein family (RNase H2 complex component) [Rhizoctonia solani]